MSSLLVRGGRLVATDGARDADVLATDGVVTQVGLGQGAPAGGVHGRAVTYT